MAQDREELYKYLDAKFEGVDSRICGLQILWEAEARTCAADRADIRKRVGLLENWRSGLTAVIAALGFLLSGIPGWVGKLFAAAGAK